MRRGAWNKCVDPLLWGKREIPRWVWSVPFKPSDDGKPLPVMTLLPRICSLCVGPYSIQALVSQRAYTVVTADRIYVFMNAGNWHSIVWHDSKTLRQATPGKPKNTTTSYICISYLLVSLGMSWRTRYQQQSTNVNFKDHVLHLIS